MTATVQLWRSVCYNSPGSSLSSRRVLSLLSPLSLVGVLTDKHKLHQFNLIKKHQLFLSVSHYAESLIVFIDNILYTARGGRVDS